MAKMRNAPGRQERRRKQRRQKRSMSENKRSGNVPASEQSDRDEDTPRPSMTGGNDTALIPVEEVQS